MLIILPLLVTLVLQTERYLLLELAGRGSETPARRDLDEQQRRGRRPGRRPGDPGNGPDGVTMSDEARDGRELGPDVIETRMGSHVEEIMSAARKAAAQLQTDVERASTERAAQLETAAARRAHAVRMGAETEADRVHAQTRAASQQYMAASRRLVDEFSKERMRRIADIGDRLAAQAEALVERLMRSDEVARQLNELRAALGAACELIAVEAGTRQSQPARARAFPGDRRGGERSRPATGCPGGNRGGRAQNARGAPRARHGSQRHTPRAGARATSATGSGGACRCRLIARAVASRRSACPS